MWRVLKFTNAEKNCSLDQDSSFFFFLREYIFAAESILGWICDSETLQGTKGLESYETWNFADSFLVKFQSNCFPG